MKSFNTILVLSLLLFSCKDQKKVTETSDELATEIAAVDFGAGINAEKILSEHEVVELYEGLQGGDTLNIAFEAIVEDVCQMKGCWMVLQLPDSLQTRVTFKDYGFFVPMDIHGQTVTVQGKAFLKEVSIEEQQHYAMESGKDPGEISAITQPKSSYAFIADGVSIPN